MTARSSRPMYVRRPVDLDAALTAWWGNVTAAGAAFLRRTVPRWGDARYGWDLVDPADRAAG